MFSSSRWVFFSYPDPTKYVLHFPWFQLRLTVAVFSGNVKCIKNNYSLVNESTTFTDGLVYIQDDGTVIMKVDNMTNLASGVLCNR